MFAFPLLSNQLWLLPHPKGPLRLHAVPWLHRGPSCRLGCGQQGDLLLSPRRAGRARASWGAAWLTAPQECRAVGPWGVEMQVG